MKIREFSHYRKQKTKQLFVTEVGRRTKEQKEDSRSDRRTRRTTTQRERKKEKMEREKRRRSSAFLRARLWAPASFRCVKTFYFFLEEEKKKLLRSEVILLLLRPPGASLHHHLSHHASPDRTLQMHYGIWGRRARGRRDSWIFDKTWDDQTEVVGRRGGSSILHHSATWILHGGNSLLIYFFSLFREI